MTEFQMPVYLVLIDIHEVMTMQFCMHSVDEMVIISNQCQINKVKAPCSCFHAEMLINEIIYKKLLTLVR